MGKFRTAGWSGQVNFLENAKTYQYHLRGVCVRSLGRQVMLYGNETRSCVLTWGEFSVVFFFTWCIFRCGIVMSYTLFNCKLLCRLAIAVLLGCCEFNPNVTCVRIHVCSRIAVPHAAGTWWEASGSAKWRCFGKQEKNKGGISTR